MQVIFSNLQSIRGLYFTENFKICPNVGLFSKLSRKKLHIYINNLDNPNVKELLVKNDKINRKHQNFSILQKSTADSQTAMILS